MLATPLLHLCESGTRQLSVLKSDELCYKVKTHTGAVWLRAKSLGASSR